MARFNRLVLWVFAALMLCAAPAAAQSLEKVSLRLDWTAVGYHAPFYLGVAKGYYRDAGLDVQILDGKGSANTATLVGSDANDFGFADATTAARLVGQGLPVKVVMGVFQRSTLSVFFPKGKGIKVPMDLKGKRVSMCAGDAMSEYLPAFLDAVGLKKDDVKFVTVDCAAKYTVVAQGQADAVASYATAGRSLLRSVGINDAGQFDYADVGIVLPSHGVITSLKKISSSPDTVRRFVTASAKSWQEASANPDAAIAALVAAVPLLKGREAVLKETLVDSMKYLTTPGNTGKPFGWQSPEEWEKAKETLVKYTNLPKTIPIDSFFTNQFVGN